MKADFLVLAIALIVLFSEGCTISSTGNVVIEDVVKEENPADITTTTVQEQQTTTTIEATTTTVQNAQPATTGNVIIIENLKFVPDKLTIQKGEAVMWKHNDQYIPSMKHMIRIYPTGAASPIMYYGETFSHTFNESGEYVIVDVIYAEKNVKGRVVVE